MPIATSAFLRDHRDEIVRRWEARLRAAEGEAGDDALRARLSALLDELASWLEQAPLPAADARAAAERERLAQQRQLALDAARMGWWHYDPATRVATFDRRYTDIFGVTGHERPNDEILKLLHPQDLPRVWAAVEAALDPVDPKPYSSEYRVIRPDGEVRWVEAHGVATFEGSGAARRATSLVGTVEDITERKQAEHALRESEARFRALADGTPILIWVTDRRGRVEFVNRAYLEFFGVTLHDLQDRGWTPLVHPDDVAAYAGAFAEAIERRTSFRAQARVRRADGAWRWIDSHGLPRLSATGEFVGMGGSSPDVTEHKEAMAERRRAEDELRASDRRKSEFLAVLSHELRNPLAPIHNSLHLLERAPPGSDVAARARDVLRRQTEHLTRLVDDLLDVTRISSGKVALQRARLDLRDVVHKATHDLRSTFDEGGLDLRVEQPADPVWVDGDATRLEQVVANLLQNASKFTPARGAVAVRVHAADGRATLSVKDTGAGIEPELLAHMFEPFVQGAQGLARATGGLGLGLALVKGLVEQHGGTVRALSEGPGRGSEVVVTLPLVEAGPRRVSAPAGAAGGPARLVLVVEDNVDAGETLADLLSLSGHRVQVAVDGRSGLALARALAPDVILCDIGLPDMDGYELARALRREPALAGARLVALTGYAQPEDRERARAAGFDAHLAKPPRIEELEALLADPPRGAPRAP